MMVFISVGRNVVDYEFGLLERILALLDVELSKVTSEIRLAQDPESDGLCDLGEFLVGSGLVAAQRYVNATRADLGLTKAVYDRPPMLNQEVSIVSAINALANYWKHSSEWDEAIRNGNDPTRQGLSRWTIEAMDRIGDLGDYPCANALAAMSPGGNLGSGPINRLASALPV